jgi:chemotaxis methyl-accepting protein methylase
MDFAEFLRRVLPSLGLAPRPHLRRGLRRKLARRLEGLRLRGWEEYAALVEADPAVRAELAGLLGVTISRFWRNYSLWEYLAAHVLPGLCEAGARVWSCGCAGGEEPYSLALLWRERCPESPLYLLATDIDTTVLERAQEGHYGPGSLRELPSELRERYFRPERGGFRLSGEVKGMVRFRRHDLLREPPPAEAPFSLILCRNLAFTYFGPEARVEAARKLAAALAPGGYLAVGRKERLPEGAADLAETGYPGLYRRKT